MLAALDQVRAVQSPGSYLSAQTMPRLNGGVGRYWLDLAGAELPSSLDGFVDRHLGPERQLTLRLA